jgi:hypothetical protein
MLYTKCCTLYRSCSFRGRFPSRILLGGRQIPFHTEPNQQVAVFSPGRFTASFESFYISVNCFARLICSVRFAHNTTLCGVGNWLKISSKQNWIFGTLQHFITNAVVSLQYIGHYVSLPLCLPSLCLTLTLFLSLSLSLCLSLSGLNKHLVAGLCHGSSRIALWEAHDSW